MPEGDTLHRTAARLRPALEGAALRRFDAPRLVGERPRSGTTIDTVEAVGKHLVVRFSGGLALQTHLRMTGSWHLYRTGERWTKPPHLARVVLEVDGWVAVCFSAPVVRTYRPDAVGVVDPTAHLGPDLCLPDVDLDAAVERFSLAEEPDVEIGVALLDQRIVSGIGNVYKSEVCFACRVDPFTPLHAVDVDARRALVRVAAKLLRANLTTTRRTTVPVAGGLAVYGRARRPCIACGTPIRMRYQGTQRRSTYWCPRCQPSWRDAVGNAR